MELHQHPCADRQKYADMLDTSSPPPYPGNCLCSLELKLPCEIQPGCLDVKSQLPHQERWTLKLTMKKTVALKVKKNHLSRRKEHQIERVEGKMEQMKRMKRRRRLLQNAGEDTEGGGCKVAKKRAATLMEKAAKAGRTEQTRRPGMGPGRRMMRKMRTGTENSGVTRKRGRRRKRRAKIEKDQALILVRKRSSLRRKWPS